MAPPDPRRDAIRKALSVSIATALYGLSFGALAVAAGLSIPQTCALSALMFSGGSQFALVGVVQAGGAPVAAISTAGLLGARNALYGAQLGPLLALRGWRRALAAHVTIDESMAVATGQPSRATARTGFWWTGIGVFVGWNALTLAGALAGSAIGDPRAWGLDAAAPAAFLGLLWPRLASRAARWTCLGAAAFAVALVPVTPGGVPILAAAGLAIGLGAVSARRAARARQPAGTDSPDETRPGDAIPPGREERL